MYAYLPTPAVVIELAQMEENIRKMTEAAAGYQIKVRPHIKPHKSVEIARLQLRMGCSGITCAKLGEAEVMAKGGIDDILIAFPLIGQEKMQRLKILSRKARVITIVNSEEGARQLSETFQNSPDKIEVLIEVDGGINRGGKKPYEPTLEFARQIAGLPGIDIKGILYYGGTIYGEKDREGFEKTSAREREEMLGTARMLENAGFHMEILSGGNSYSSKMPWLLEGITEIRPGHYLFNDVGQLMSGFAKEQECALRVTASVVSIVDERHAIIDAGSKTLTTDICARKEGYGYVVGRPDITISKLNEEHGFIESEGRLGLEIGDKIAVIPNHACVVPILADEVYGIRNGKLDHLIRIDARGKNR